MLFIIQGSKLTEKSQEITQWLGSPINKYSQFAHGYEANNAPMQQIKQYCHEHELDLACMEYQVPWRDIKLLAMDMDSTLINIECIDEIADLQGIKSQVANITAAAMRGEIDFSESLRQRVALLKDLPTQALDEVLEHRLRLNPGAEKLIHTAKHYGVTTLLVSGGFTFFTQALQQRLSLDHAYANELEIHRQILTGQVLGDIVDGKKKASHVARLKQQLACSDEQVIVIGDGANDLAMMAHSNFSIAYHAKPVVQESARFAINHGGLDSVINLFAT